MEIILTPTADADLKYWSTSGKTLVLKKIRQLLESIIESPFEGIGKPEPLKFNLVGCWSRRITKADRLVYEVTDSKIIVHSLRGHYI
jgi:toxin YoeB